MILRYGVGEETREVRLEPEAENRWRVTLEGCSFDVALRGDPVGAFLDLLVDGRLVEAIVVADGERRIVKIGDGDPVTLARLGRERGAGPAAQRVADGRLTAIMDGEVVAIPAVPGALVSTGAPLIVIEAMKMEMKVVAPFAGRVARIACAVGDVVTRGQVLAEVEPEDAGS